MEMEDTSNNTNPTAEANATSHYTTITVGIVIGLIGIFLRFTGTWPMIDLVSNVIWVVGIVICLRSVLRILK
jgi:F0F1-type ATP synthase assembly protein I